MSVESFSPPLTLPSPDNNPESPSSLSSHITLYNQIINSNNILAIEAIEFILKCVSRYGFNNISLSFNGGKDCTVLFHLLRSALSSINIPFHNLHIIYFHEQNEFPEITSFMHSTAKLYDLKLVEISGTFIEGLTKLLKNTDITAIFMGQRNSDPNCSNIELISHSDAGWPHFDRINPILNWSYSDVWNFLREFNLPYCNLYDQGYTSIGNKLNSIPNPLLAVNGGYKPAYELLDESAERLGRIAKSSMQNSLELVEMKNDHNHNQLLSQQKASDNSKQCNGESSS